MEAIIFVGIQATGKTTFYRERFFHTHVRISLDMLQTRRRERAILHACIDTEQPFVVDNTNATVIDRARYILPARKAEFQIIGYYFNSAVTDAILRNNGRAGARRIPPAGIGNTTARLEPPQVPEGFHELYFVSIPEAGKFSVEAWQRDPAQAT